MPSAEPLSLEKEAPSRSQQTGGPPAGSAPPGAAFDPFVDRLFNSAPAEPPDSAAGSLSIQRLKAPVLQRAQRLYGNRASQQIVMRARVLQRQCKCGGTCEKCQNEEEEEQRFLQRSSAAQAPAEFDGVPTTHGEPLDVATRPSLEAHFGADLADVRVHAGSEAAHSATKLDALAYTAGRDIYFAAGMYSPASSDGRRLLAHEVAHVVQQGSGKEPGIATKSGGIKIGAPDDMLESEADRAAEEFMSGTPLTDEEQRKRPEARHNVQRFIQRQPHPGGERTTPDYVNDNAKKLVTAIMKRIEQTPLTQPHPRLTWWVESEAKDALKSDIADYIEIAPDLTLKRMMMLSYPVDLFDLVDKARRGPQGSRFEVVQLVVAAGFDEPLRASIRRMGTRTVVQLDLHGFPLQGSSVVASSPLDALIAGILVNTKFVNYHRPKPGAPDDTGGRPFAKGTRAIRYEWQGSRDPNLWNWIKVTWPPDATVEDVANNPFVGDSVMDGSEQAYRIPASPPYFGIPFETARLVEDAKKYATYDVKIALDTGPGPRVADPSALAMSAISDSAAQAQAPPASRDDPPPAQTLERIQLQINFMDRQLGMWRENGRLAGVKQFLMRRRQEFDLNPAAAGSWTAALASQERLLFAASSELTSVLDEVAKATAKAPQDPAVSLADNPGLLPVKYLVREYAKATALSHLHAQAAGALAEARQMKSTLPLAMAEYQISLARHAIAEQREAEAGVKYLEHGAKTTEAMLEQLRTAADLRLQVARGQPLDPDVVEQLSIDASETELRAHLVRIATRAHEAMRKADDVGLDQGPYPSGAWSVHMIGELILKKVNGPWPQPPVEKNDHSGGGWHEHLDVAGHWEPPLKRQNENRRLAFRAVTQELNLFVSELNSEEDFFKWAYEQIEKKEVRDMLFRLAVELGVSLLTGQVIGLIGTGIRAITLAGEVGAELREAGLLFKGTQLLATAGANTATQAAFGDEVGVREFAENTLGIVLTEAALKPFHEIFKDSENMEQEIQTWGRKAGRFGKAAAGMVIETGASIGASAVAHALTHQGEISQAGAQEVINIGLSIAAGRLVHHQMQGMEHRIVEYYRETNAAHATALLERVSALEQRSTPRKDAKPAPEEALEMLKQRRALLLEELSLYGTDPQRTKAVKDIQAELAKTGAEFIDAPLQLAGLSPVIEGHIYEGSKPEIDRAIKATEEVTGVSLKPEGPTEDGVFRVKVGDRVIEIHERGRAPKPHEALRAAEALPGSAFTGMAPPSVGRPKIKLAQVKLGASRAVEILNKGGGPRSFIVQADGSVVVNANGRQMLVRFEMGSPRREVAVHDYVQGATEVTVTISEQAREQDLSRAAAHELEEVAALLEDPARDRPGVLHAGSKAAATSQLSGHDYGRIAELRVLAQELQTQPARHQETLGEIDVLLDHLGFDVREIGSDPHARTLLGDAVVGPIASAAKADVTPASAPAGGTTPKPVEQISRVKARVGAVLDGVSARVKRETLAKIRELYIRSHSVEQAVERGAITSEDANRAAHSIDRELEIIASKSPSVRMVWQEQMTPSGAETPARRKRPAQPSGPGTAGARFERSYHFEGDPRAIRDSKNGFQVYEYRNRAGDLLYVGMSGGIKDPYNWMERFYKDHIRTEWIGEAYTVTVTSELNMDAALALEEVMIPKAKYNKKPGEFSSKKPEGVVSDTALAASKHGTQGRFRITVME